jgi:hypothetical protein
VRGSASGMLGVHRSRRVNRVPCAAYTVAALAVLELAAAGAAQAHEFWLVPSTYRPTPHDTVQVHAFVGSGFRGETKPFATPRAIRFTLLGAKSIDLRRATANGELCWARYIPPDDGGQLLAYESNYTQLELPAPRFDDYLATEGLDTVLAARRALGPQAGPGRERYARCAKTWIGGTHPERACVAQGLPLEIVPLADPEAGPKLTIRVLYRGQPLANALVRAWARPLAAPGVPFDAAARDSVAPVEQRRTGRDGRATLDVHRDGEWLVNAVHMVRSEEPSEADWQSLWASFTFVRRARAH